MIDTTKQYLFHNIYGDANDLIANKPDNVILVPFGWDEETENVRNSLMKELNLNITSLPSLAFWGKSYEYVTGRNVTISYPQQWEEVRIGTLEKPWNWSDIQLCIDAFFDNPIEGVPSGIPN